MRHVDHSVYASVRHALSAGVGGNVRGRMGCAMGKGCVGVVAAAGVSATTIGGGGVLKSVEMELRTAARGVYKTPREINILTTHGLRRYGTKNYNNNNNNNKNNNYDTFRGTTGARVTSRVRTWKRGLLVAGFFTGAAVFLRPEARHVSTTFACRHAARNTT